MSVEYEKLVYQFAIVSFFFPVLLGSILVWFILSYQKKKHQNETERKDALLREQALLIEKQQAIETERTRIAAEMHDDLGSGLTTIRYLSDKALQQAKDTAEAEQINRIAEHSNRLVRNMSEIIWAMNARFDNAESLVSYLRRYASEFLEEHHMPLQFKIEQDSLDTIPFSGEKRRNIFLVFKEILHNTIKYAQAKGVSVSISTGDVFTIHILEKGAMGFDPQTAIEKGNGLYNIRKRMDAIRGHIRYQKSPEGMEITITIPLNPTTDGQA